MDETIRKRSQILRKEATKEERRLWYEFLREQPCQFHRQKCLGRYIVDFYCPSARLVVELDGPQHYEEAGIQWDAERTAYLEGRGLRVLRFTNLEVNNRFSGVCQAILQALEEAAPSSDALRAPASPHGGSLPRGGTDEAANAARQQERPMKTVTIYTDGACSGNPGPGGWGAILMYGPHKKELSGGEANTTNNRMELTAVIQALSLLKEPCIVDLWSDSKYVIDALEKGWARGWKARGWVKSDKKPALNPDLWDRLLALAEVHTLRCHWVKGHAENEYNNRCDELAVAESQKYK